MHVLQYGHSPVASTLYDGSYNMVHSHASTTLREQPGTRRGMQEAARILGREQALERHYRARRRHVQKRIKQYGITVDDWDRMMFEQEGCCAICSVVLASFACDGEVACVDHCHETGVVRGLLCQACNHGIGHLRDNPNNLQRAIEYLEAVRQTTTPIEIERD